MYNAIHSQLRAIDSIRSENADRIQQLADYLQVAPSVTLFGIGSSLHSAQLAAALWREVRPSTYVTVEHSFDVASGLTNLRPQLVAASATQHLAVALSHRGRKKYTVEALALTRELGVTTCSITGKGVTVADTEADLHITTTEQERSSAHTASLLGSFTVCAAAIDCLVHSGADRPTLALKHAIAGGISSEETIRTYAQAVPSRVRHLWLVGGGSDAVVAREVALKIKETSYIPSEGMSVEEFAHGPFQCVDPLDQILFIDTQPYASSRISTLRAMAEVVGVPSVTITTDSNARCLAPSSHCVVLPSSSIRTLNSVAALVSLQLYTYFLALARGTDPDRFRLDDSRFQTAANLISL
jgi:glucosamine--fructose-6-phosphate aminotransferase (isomerizing)